MIQIIRAQLHPLVAYTRVIYIIGLVLYFATSYAYIQYIIMIIIFQASTSSYFKMQFQADDHAGRIGTEAEIKKLLAEDKKREKIWREKQEKIWLEKQKIGKGQEKEIAAEKLDNSSVMTGRGGDVRELENDDDDDDDDDDDE